MPVQNARVDSVAYHARDHDNHALRAHANDQLQLTARYPHNRSCQSYKNSPSGVKPKTRQDPSGQQHVARAHEIAARGGARHLHIAAVAIVE